MAVAFIILAVMLFAGWLIAAQQERYHEAGEETDYRNLAEHGTPQKSLFTSTAFFSLHHRIEITDADGAMQYCSETQFPTLLDKTTITNRHGKQIAYVERKLFSLHERHFIAMADGTRFELSNELFHIVEDVTNIEGLGWRLTGNFLRLNYVIRDQSGRVLAVVGQKVFSVHDKYSIDIYDISKEEEIIAIAVTLQHMVNDRRTASSANNGTAGT